MSQKHCMHIVCMCWICVEYSGRYMELRSLWTYVLSMWCYGCHSGVSLPFSWIAISMKQTDCFHTGTKCTDAWRLYYIFTCFYLISFEKSRSFDKCLVIPISIKTNPYTFKITSVTFRSSFWNESVGSMSNRCRSKCIGCCMAYLVTMIGWSFAAKLQGRSKI